MADTENTISASVRRQTVIIEPAGRDNWIFYHLHNELLDSSDDYSSKVVLSRFEKNFHSTKTTSLGFA